MMLFRFAAGGLLLLLACQSPSASAPAGAEESARRVAGLWPGLGYRPHIVWLVAEDLSPVLPMYGDSTIETPHLSRLAAEGIVFERAFSPSGVCAPSRAALATGMYPTHIGAMHMRTGGSVAYLPAGHHAYEAQPGPEVKMHSEYLRRLGYYCTNNPKEDYQFRRGLMAWDESSGQAHWRNRAPGQPFFAIFNDNVCHESRIWTKAEDSLWIAADQPVPVPPYLPDNEVGRRDLRRMYSNIKEMDAQVGVRLAELEAAGLLDSTIIFWYGDHGGPLPRQKRLCYDSGLRVPLIVRFPDGWGAGTRDTNLVSFVDFLPTLLSLVGAAPPPHLDGQAFLGPYQAPPRSYIHGAGDRFDGMTDMIRAVRDHRYKYLRNFRPDQGYYLPVTYREQMPIMQELLRLRAAGTLTEAQAQWFRSTKPEEELFDTWTDPHELNNLAAEPRYADKLAELRAECERWMSAVEDKGIQPERDYLATIWPGGQQPVTAPPVPGREGAALTLTCETPGASLGYQLLAPGDSLAPAWAVYTEPIVVPTGRQLVAVAHRLGYAPSPPVYVE